MFLQRPPPEMERPPTLRVRRIRCALACHAMPLIQVDEDFSGTLADGSLQRGDRHREDRGPRYRLQQLATGFGRVAPDLYSIRSLRRLGSAPSAAFADRVADVSTIADQIDAAAVFHDTRSY